MYFHSDTLVFQDRDLEIPAYLLDSDVAEEVIVSGAPFTREGLDSISLTIDIPMSTLSHRNYSSQMGWGEEQGQTAQSIQNIKFSSEALEAVSFANPTKYVKRVNRSNNDGIYKHPEVTESKLGIQQPSALLSDVDIESEIQHFDSPLWTLIDEAFAGFVGMQYLKMEIFKQASLIKVQQLRKEQGIISSMNPSRHMVFRGSPGTGKTTVARIIADVYFELGLLPTNEVVETDRSDLVGQYLGETAIKTAAVVRSAIGGVLFIDEAYSLTEGEHNEYGREAINTLLKLMEDHREELVVIVAGYQNEMLQFVDSNPGLKSRFNRVFDFHNYTPEELWEILEKMCNTESYIIKDKANIKEAMLIEFQKEIEREGISFSNGRYIRNLFERIVENQSFRVVVNNQLDKLDLMTLQECDFTNVT